MAGRRNPLMYKLVKFTDWYIDSIYIQSFCVMTEDGYDEFDKLLAKAQKIVEEKDVRIRLPYADGHFVYHDVPELCESLEIRDITEQQAKAVTEVHRCIVQEYACQEPHPDTQGQY